MISGLEVIVCGKYFTEILRRDIELPALIASNLIFLLLGDHMTNLKKSAQEALNFARSQRSGEARTLEIPTASEIKELRTSLTMTQVDFARLFEFDLASLRSWEQGRRSPDMTTCLVFAMLMHNPKQTIEIVRSSKRSRLLKDVPESYANVMQPA